MLQHIFFIEVLYFIKTSINIYHYNLYKKASNFNFSLQTKKISELKFYFKLEISFINTSCIA
jgi:hypothetical protein